MQSKLKVRPDPIEVEGVLMQEVLRKSPIPVYGVGAVWVLYAFLLPLYRWFDFVIAAAASVAAYLLLSKLFPGRKELIPAVERPAATGIAAADQLISEGREALRELRRINGEIPDPALTAKINRMTGVAGKIVDFVEENPSKAGTVRKFMNYYLPTMLDLLRSYAKLERQEVDGKNITTTMGEIERVVDAVIPAFEKQLDALFQDEALDASVDIEVLRSMLAQEGLTGGDFRSKE